MGQGNVFLNKGNIFVHLSKYSKAIEMYDKAMALFTERGFNIGIGHVFKGKGDIFFYEGNYTDAEMMNEKALFYYNTANFPLGQADVLKQKGDIYLIKCDYKNAEEMYDKAMIIFENIGVPLGMIETYIGKGDIYYYRGELIDAEKMYNKALALLERGESMIQRGDVYKRKGNICFYNGDYVNSIDMYRQSLAAYKKAGEDTGIINVLKSKGDLYFYRGNYIYAEKMYDDASKHFEKSGDKIGLGNVSQCLGNIYLEMENYKKAQEMYDKALKYFKEVDEPIGQGNVLISKGDIYFYNQDPINAEKMYDQALSFFEKSEESFGQAEVYYRKGGIYLHNGDISGALEMNERALKLCQKTGNIESKAYVLYAKAKALVKLGKRDEALANFEKGIADLENARTQTKLLEMKRTFMEKVYKQYEGTVLFMMQNGFYEKGFEYAEKMRARVFSEILYEGMKEVDKGLSPGLKKRRDQLVFNLSMKLVDKFKKKEVNEKELNEIGIQLDNLSVEIRKKNQAYASLYYPEPVKLRNLQQNILKNNELLIEYFFAEEGIYVFLVSRENFKVKKLEVNIKSIEESVKKYINTIPKTQPGESVSEENIRIKCLFDLYRLIFKSIENDTKGRKLILSPNRQLAKIPFEALVSDWDKKTGKTVFLIEKNPIKYIQSASILSSLRSGCKNKVVNEDLVAFGDPVYDYDNFKKGKPEKGSRFRALKEKDELMDINRSRYLWDRGPLYRLNASSEEVKIIAELFKKKGKKKVLYLREKATEKNAKSPAMNRFGFIHFACHGVAGDELQSLVLSQLPSDKSKEDGFLTLNEIMNCKYNAQLVVLSGCETNLGKIVRGEGIIGLTRAFMYAGTPAVIASLWNVKDSFPKELMVRFYKNLLEKKMDRSEALRQAKLELLKAGKYSSPRHWSAFIMYGE